MKESDSKATWIERACHRRASGIWLAYHFRQRTLKILHPEYPSCYCKYCLLFFTTKIDVCMLIVKSVYHFLVSHLFDFRNDEQEIYHFASLFITLRFYLVQKKKKRAGNLVDIRMFKNWSSKSINKCLKICPFFVHV